MRLLLALLLLAAPASAGKFDEMIGEDGPVRFSGLLDVRYARTSQQRSWLIGGPNKLRFGGADIDGNGSGDREANVLAVPQASLVIDAEVPQGVEVHAQVNMDADSDSGNGSIGLVEAFAHRAFEPNAGHIALRGGAFIPPISFEHSGPAWSTEQTLTPSAIGSWIGEEVRAFGGEITFTRALGETELSATAAVFGGSDQAGNLLLYRGWALHDYQATLTQSFPVTGGSGSTVERPFKELDGRAGYYGRTSASFGGGWLRIKGGFYDNNGDPNRVAQTSDGPLEVWSTQFGDVGLQAQHGGTTLTAQWMRGFSASLTCPRWPWQSWYVMGSQRLGAWSIATRYDRFSVNHRRFEDGYAGTASLQWHMSVRQRLAAEYITLWSKPNLVVRPSGRSDRIAQLNYRFLFGS
jgi:hypothetical protein